MFYNYFVELCNKARISPSKAAQQIGLSKSSVSGWKNGSIPRDSQIIKIANFFEISAMDIYEAINYEIAQSQGGGVPGTRSGNKKEKPPMQLSIGEENIIRLYRSFSESDQGKVQAFVASLEKSQGGKQ